LFTTLSVLSLLLCLATIGLWVRSYKYSDTLYYMRSVFRIWAIQSLRGQIAVGTNFLIPSDPRSERIGLDVEDARQCSTVQEHSHGFRYIAPVGWLCGFGFAFVNLHNRIVYHAVGIPHWFLAVLLAVLPALYLRTILRSRKRDRKGLCPVCGYDLRATPDRCPECGTAPART
jgi:hypothetical protein